VYSRPQYPPIPRSLSHAATLSYGRNNELIDAAKARISFDLQAEAKREIEAAQGASAGERHAPSGAAREAAGAWGGAGRKR
jgi:hypothetical protein